MKGSRGGSWGDGLSLAPLGVEGKWPRSTSGLVGVGRRDGGSGWTNGVSREGHRLPCSRPARYALWAICDVLPPHFPVLRFACPKFQPRSGVSAGFAEARGVMGAGVVLARAFQDWVKPEVDPPRIGPAARGVKWEGHRLPCSRPARYALWAICDVLPPHFPVLRFACPRFQPRSGVSGGHGRLGRAGAKRGLFIAEVAEQVLFTVGTTVPPCLAKGKPARSGVCSPDRVVEGNYFTSGSTVTHLRSAQLLRPSSANWTPLAPRRRSHGNGSSRTMWRRKSSHWILKALS